MIGKAFVKFCGCVPIMHEGARRDANPFSIGTRILLSTTRRFRN